MRTLKLVLGLLLVLALVGVSAWWMQLGPFVPKRPVVTLPSRAPWETETAAWTKALDPADAFAADLRGTHASARLDALRALPLAKGIEPARKAAMMLEQLRREVTKPPPAEALHGSYLPTTSTVRLACAYNLGALGDEGVRAAKAAEATASDEEREWLVIARGFARDTSATDGVVKLLRESQAPDRRIAAARALVHLKDPATAPALEAALSDDFAPEHEVLGKRVTLYPVRTEAARALAVLGVTYRATGPGQWEKEAPP